MLVTLGVGVGTIVILYGIFSMLVGKSYLFGGDTKRFTEKSVRLFARISGAVEIILGVAVIVFAFGQTSGISVIVSWLSASVIWIAAAGIVTMYLTVLVKKE